MVETKVQKFKEKEFLSVIGSLHRDYSSYTFEVEEKEIKEQYWNVKPGDIVFDIGASYGGYSLPAAVSGATVYAFEPEKMVFDDLEKNVNINNLQDKCFIFNEGMWDEIAHIHMKQYATHWSDLAISGIYSMNTIDNFVKEHDIKKIDWIKIDVEGAEENVIKGGLKSIEQFHPKLIIECHTFLDDQIANRIKSLLKIYSFEEVLRDPCKMLIGEYNAG